MSIALFPFSLFAVGMMDESGVRSATSQRKMLCARGLFCDIKAGNPTLV